MAAPAWGKFWLSVLNVYEWEGNNPVPPELWCCSSDLTCYYHCSPPSRVLPEWLPFHPHRWWIHCRMVYLPMSYLYGSRFKARETDLILSLREVHPFPVAPIISAEFSSPGNIYSGLLFHRLGGARQQCVRSRLICTPFRSIRWSKHHPRPVREVLPSPASSRRSQESIRSYTHRGRQHGFPRSRAC